MNPTILIDRTALVLEPLGFKLLNQKQPRGATGRQPDARLRIARGKERLDYAAEVKQLVTPATLGAVVAQLRHTAEVTGQAALLVTNCVTPPVADRLREQRQQFVDTAGNAYLEGPGLYVYVTGQKNKDRPMTPNTDKAFTINGLKVIFALLCDPALALAPYRTIAAAAGVALGALPAVLAGIKQGGHLLVMGRRRRLVATKRLLDEWAMVYARKLYPRLLIGRYYIPALAGWEKWPVQKYGALWGGQPAGALLTDYLRPGELQIYAEKLPGLLAAQRKFAKLAEPGHTAIVEVRRKFWNFKVTEPRADVTPPALVYADLLATGDARCIETAGMIYEKHLARFIPAQ